MYIPRARPLCAASVVLIPAGPAWIPFMPRASREVSQLRQWPICRHWPFGTFRWLSSWVINGRSKCPLRAYCRARWRRRIRASSVSL